MLGLCDIGGITGWMMPGSETCVKLSGYVTGHFYAGTLSQQWLWSGNQVTHDGTLAGMKLGLVHGVDGSARDAIGFAARPSTAFDFVSNTAYGPLLGHINLFAEAGSGFEAPANDAYLNRAYVTWAGITAGKANSFFSLFGGGETWPSFFSPDRRGWNQPDLMAYTASFPVAFRRRCRSRAPARSAHPDPAPGYRATASTIRIRET